MTKRYSPAWSRNSAPIAEVLAKLVTPGAAVLEVGSGSGQHAVDYARRFAEVTWQPTELPGCLESIDSWRDEAGSANLAAPAALDLCDSKTWPTERYDLVIAINVIHIAAWSVTQKLFDLARAVSTDRTRVFLYGPFRYNNKDLEPSNVAFDQHLKAQDPGWGVRMYEDVNACAIDAGFELEGDQSMPSNNRALWWLKSPLAKETT